MTDQELYDKYRGYTFSIAQRMAGTYRLAQEDVEDIASASLTMLLFKAHKIDFSQPESVVFVYCRTILTNAARTALTELLELRGHVSLDAPASEDEDTGSLHDFLPDQRADTERALLAKESRCQARQYLKQRWHKITPEYRMLVTRRFGLDGKEPISFRDLAAELGQNAKVIRWKVNKALEKLRSNRR